MASNSTPRPSLLRRPLPPVNKTQSQKWRNNKRNVLREADSNDLVNSYQGASNQWKRNKLRTQTVAKLAEEIDNSNTSLHKKSDVLLPYQPPRIGHYPFPLRSAKKPKQIDPNAFLEDSYKPLPPSFTLKDFLRTEKDYHLIHYGVAESEASPTDINIYFDEDKLSRCSIDKEETTVKSCVLDLDDSVGVPAVIIRRPHRQVLIEEKVKQLQREVTALEEQYKTALQNRRLYWPSVVQPTYLDNASPSYSSEYHYANNETSVRQHDRTALPANNYVYQDHKTSDIQKLNDLIEDRVQDDHLPRDLFLANSPPVYFQGSRSARSASPFEFSEVQGMYPIELAVLDCLAHGGTKLNMKAHFMETLPDIEKIVGTLTYVNLSFNDFVSIPSEIFKAIQLTTLKMRNNPIHEIPRSIRKLKKLKSLVLSFCCISSLPPSLFKLTRLELLDLSYNKLTFIPDEIKYLRHLRDLNVDGNQLSSFPRGILQLNISFLRVANNFIHPLFWRDLAIPQPLRLLEIAATYFVSNGLHLDFNLDEKLTSYIERASICDYCGGPKFGQGVRVVKPALELFGVKNCPILFHVCSQTCKRALKRSTEISPCPGT